MDKLDKVLLSIDNYSKSILEVEDAARSVIIGEDKMTFIFFQVKTVFFTKKIKHTSHHYNLIIYI